jgi:hypothetical protein
MSKFAASDGRKRDKKMRAACAARQVREPKRGETGFRGLQQAHQRDQELVEAIPEQRA